MRWAMVFAVALSLGAASPSASAAELPVLEPPTVRADAVVAQYLGQPVLLVRTLTVQTPVNAQIHIDCGCVRRPRQEGEHDLRPGVKRYTGVDWMLRMSDRVEVYVREAGAIGRYLILKPAEPLRRRALMVVTKGCLANGSKRISCPTPPTEKQTEKPTEKPKEEKHETPPPPLDGKPETVGGLTHTHSDFSSAGGTEGPVINTGETVEVACRVQGFKVEDGDTWWYQISSVPWSGMYYASADAFYNNGQETGTLIGTPPVDPEVREC